MGYHCVWTKNTVDVLHAEIIASEYGHVVGFPQIKRGAGER